MNVKCVKDYEEEIAHLKAENFDLKTQLTHTQVPSNLPKVLYENRQQIDSLESQRRDLQTAIDNTNRSYEALVQEKRLLENKYNQDMSLSNEKIGLLEDENKRLVLRLERFNREIQETQNVRSELAQASKELSSMKVFIQDLQTQNEQLRYECNGQLEDIRAKAENYRKSIEAEMASKDFEVEGYKKKYEAECMKNKNNALIINDLKSTLNLQIKEKSMIQEEMEGASSSLRVQLNDLLKKNQDLVGRLSSAEQYVEKAQSDHRTYMGGMERFKSIISQRMSTISQSLVDLSEQLLGMRKACYVSDENRNFLARAGARYSSVNDIIVFFREKRAETHRKMEMLRKEVSDATFFASNNRPTLDKKTLEILRQFREQFNEAKGELVVCKKYLEKKALENKTLKNENARLLNEAFKKGRQVENVGKMHERVAERTGAQWDAMRI